MLTQQELRHLLKKKSFCRSRYRKMREEPENEEREAVRQQYRDLVKAYEMIIIMASRANDDEDSRVIAIMMDQIRLIENLAVLSYAPRPPPPPAAPDADQCWIFRIFNWCR